MTEYEDAKRSAVARLAGETVAASNPYAIKKIGSSYKVVKVSDGKVMGTHPTREQAMKQFKALEIAAHKERA